MNALTPEQQQNIEQAIQTLRNTVDINPSNWDAWLSLSELLAPTAPYEEAAEVIQTAIEGNPKENRGWLLMAQVIVKKHGAGSAMGWLDEAISANPQLPGPPVAKAWLLTANGSGEQAVEEYLAITEKFPEDWQAFSDVGVIYLRQGNSESAAYYLDKASKLYRDSQILWFYLASANLMNGNFDNAIAAADEAILREENHGPSYLTRAEAREKAGQLKLAMSDYEKARQLIGEQEIITTAITRLSGLV